MKKMKFWRLVILAVIVLLPQGTMATQKSINGIYYNLNSEDKTATVLSSRDDHKEYYTGDITIPETVSYRDVVYKVVSISGGAFTNCTDLTSIIIGNNVTTIGGSAFFGCSSLTSITIPNSVTSIGGYAFEGCNALTSITIPNGVTSIGESTFCYCSSLISIIIPNGVTTIGGSAFSGCSSLTSITIPNSVTTIGGSAFFGCSSLTSITIPNSVTSIGGCAFSDCSGLAFILVDSNNPIYDSRNNCNAIIETSSNSLINGCKNTFIPSSVTEICGLAFAGCSGLTSITIPNGVTTIGGCAFSGCSGLTSVTIPNSITTIHAAAFENCSSILNFYCYAEKIPSTSGSAFNNSTTNATLHVPAVKLSKYQSIEPWSYFSSIVALTDDDPKPTGIGEVRSKMTDVRGAYYDLNGRKLKGESTQKGLYIVNGKKVAVR